MTLRAGVISLLLWTCWVQAEVVEVAGGELSIMTYNIAGLPQRISKLSPSRYDRMGPLLNEFDIVLVQEDFWYHDRLNQYMAHPYKSDPNVNNWVETLWGLHLVNDGLNRFSKYPFTELFRHSWADCYDYFNTSGHNGNDCLARKGFSFASHTFTADDGSQTEVDIYNLHLESSTKGADIRSKQLTELFNHINNRTTDNTLIVVGDFNFSGNQKQLYERFAIDANLTDSIAELSNNVDKGSVDRILYRSSNITWFKPVSYERYDNRFKGLSDHAPKHVTFQWGTYEEKQEQKENDN